MKLWMVAGEGWGVEFNIVRAATRDDAIAVAKAIKSHVEVTELDPNGQEAILWSYDHSPDSPRD